MKLHLIAAFVVRQFNWGGQKWVRNESEWDAAMER